MKKLNCIVILSSLVMLILISGCFSEKMDVRPEKVYAKAPPTVKPADGSIWRGENDRSMIFTDKRARYMDDIVTIVVSETAQGNNKASTDTSRDTSTSAAISTFLGLESSLLSKNANMGSSIQLGGTNSNSLKGSGDTSRNTTLTAKVSARVIRVLDNGNLQIEGRRQVTVNAEDQYLIISGIIRPQDVTTDNTVDSKYIADARIVYTGEGVINDKMRPGWMTRIVDWVWPF